MKRGFFAIFVALLLAWSGASAETIPVQDYIRLHVIAHSDSEADQALKLVVRDAVLEETRALLAGAESPEEAFTILGEALPQLEACARDAAEAAGFVGQVQAETGVFAFPDREYGDLLVPAGEYRALRVVLGAGEGRNWWCVLYPTLCAIDENGEFVAEQAEIVFYSSIGRWLQSVLRGINR